MNGRLIRLPRESEEESKDENKPFSLESTRRVPKETRRRVRRIPSPDDRRTRRFKWRGPARRSGDSEATEGPTSVS
jgi:hypothetical protein